MNETEIEILAAKIAERIITLPRWMRLRQAALYSSIGKERLIELAKQKQIDGFQDVELKSKPWIFDRKSIDIYRTGQSAKRTDKDAEKFALDFMQRTGLL